MLLPLPTVPHCQVQEREIACPSKPIYAQTAPHPAHARAARGTCACPQSAGPRPAAPLGATARSGAPRAAPTPAAPCAAGPPSTAAAPAAGRPARRRRAPRLHPHAGPRSTSAWAARTTVRHQPNGGNKRVFALKVQVQVYGGCYKCSKSVPGRRCEGLPGEQGVCCMRHTAQRSTSWMSCCSSQGLWEASPGSSRGRPAAPAHQ